MPNYNNQYLTLVAKGSGNFRFEISNANSEYYYSIDEGQTWNTGRTILVSNGDRVMYKGTLTPTSSTGVGRFSATANFEAEGNAMSLLYGDNFEGQTDLSGKDGAFCGMFSGCSRLTSIDSLVLPATTLADSCYVGMFYGCSGLTSIPSGFLPATSLSFMCYAHMFERCSSLTTVPSNLLPATTLLGSCYSSMFYLCKSLTTAPNLPATTLHNWCYSQMFYNCTSLNEIHCYATDISASGCTSKWVSGVASSGTFYKNQNMNDWTRSISGIPVTWNVVDYYEPIYKWERITPIQGDPSTFICDECPAPQYRWTATTGYECSGTTKMTQEKKQVSYDSGETWTDVSPLETRAALPVIEEESEDCGFVSGFTIYRIPVGRCIAPNYGQRYSIQGTNGYTKGYSVNCTPTYQLPIFENVPGIIHNFGEKVCDIGETVEFITDDGITYTLTSRRGNNSYYEGYLEFRKPN